MAATAEAKGLALARMAEEERQVAAAVSRGGGCGPCDLLSRLVRGRRSELGGEAVFGQRARKSEASGLDAALEAMAGREAALSDRAADARREALRLNALGQKPQALRSLKRAKVVERQLEALQQSMSAVEAQKDLIEQAAVQKQVASALSSTSKAMKGTKKTLAKAESAVDEVAEANDMANELSAVMSELGAAHDAFDDDELMAELAALEGAAEPAAPAAPAAAAERAELRGQIELHEQAAAVKAGLPLPSRKLPEEKRSLLSSA